MNGTRIYLDHAATTPLLPQAKAAVAEAMSQWANPSSVHAEGRSARAALEDSRRRIGRALDWRGDLLFTATATEAAALAFRRWQSGPPPIISAVEHDAIGDQCAEDARTVVPVDRTGIVDRDALEAALAASPGGLVAVQHVNSETGIVQPIAAIHAIVERAGSHLLVDCAQSAGKLPLPPADLAIVNASKVGGPPGASALLARDLSLLVPSGGQERGYRRGTENLPAIMGFAAAIEAEAWDMALLTRLRDMLEDRLRRHGATIIGESATRSPAIGAYAMPGLSAMAQLVRFDSLGFAVSAGSACASGTTRKSAVLDAMQVDDDIAERTIRVSFGPSTSEDEVAAFADAWIKMAEDAAAKAA